MPKSHRPNLPIPIGNIPRAGISRPITHDQIGIVAQKSIIDEYLRKQRVSVEEAVAKAVGQLELAGDQYKHVAEGQLAYWTHVLSGVNWLIATNGQRK